MTEPQLAAVVLAGGKSTRMRSATSKHLHPVLGRRLIDWTLASVRSVDPDRLVVVISPELGDAVEGVEIAVQDEARGSGDAAATAHQALASFEGDVLVVADTPLMTQEVLTGLVDTHRRERAAATVLTFTPGLPLPYGRIVRDADGSVEAIVEEKDATAEQREITELNTSIYVFDAAALWPALERLDATNAQGELYLTDAVRHIRDAGGRVAAYESPDPWAPVGVNDRTELAAAARVLRDRINEAHMLAGVTIVDPDSTWIDADVVLAVDSTIHPFTVLRGRTQVGEGADVGPHVVAVDTQIDPRVPVGPFCYPRPGTVLEAGAKAGTFVEIKNSRVGEGTKVPHLSYIGDADIGPGTNVGAGNITANFPHQPGKPKSRTTIGRNVRTGVQNAFVAPLEIGDGAWIAAGSVITKDVPPGALAVARARQENKEGYADRGARTDDD